MPGAHRRARKAPKQARSKALVEALVTAAEQVVAERGLEAATTEAIARRAGVSIGSLYQYFPDKRALLAEAIARRSTAGNGAMVALAGQMAQQPLALAVRAMVRLLVTTFAAEREVYAGLHREADVVGEGAAHRKDLERVIDASGVVLGAHAEAIAPRKPAQAAYVLTIACTALVRDAAAHRPDLLEGGALEAELTRLCLAYLGVVTA